MKSSKDASHTPNELLGDLQALVVEAEAMMADSVSEHSSEAIENLRARFNAAQERLSGLYEGAKKRVMAGAKCTDETIRANPYQSIAIAAGAGLLVGVLVGRRSK
ncbi:MAG TPA: hypothetical protein VL357_11555 [Rariglobus sp.]|jgi:ElaB/YqjD/DUF883 family membrane-anchored ribosome-binding protein|nr:hypothetical protein [Rariglobus sp.]